MSNVKTSAESPAATLSGTELVRIVQGGINVRTSTSAIAALGSGYSVVSQPYAATITFDLSPYAGIPEVVIVIGTLTGNLTFNLTNGQDFQKITVVTTQDVSGSRIWSSGANLSMSADITSIVLSTAGSKEDWLAFRWRTSNGKARILAINKGF